MMREREYRRHRQHRRSMREDEREVCLICVLRHRVQQGTKRHTYEREYVEEVRVAGVFFFKVCPPETNKQTHLEGKACLRATKAEHAMLEASAPAKCAWACLMRAKGVCGVPSEFPKSP